MWSRRVKDAEVESCYKNNDSDYVLSNLFNLFSLVYLANVTYGIILWSHLFSKVLLGFAIQIYSSW